MEAFSKILELLSRSIKSLRWYALAGVLIGSYLKYAPDRYLILVDREVLNKKEITPWLGLLVLVSLVLFVLGWAAAGIDVLASRFREKVRNEEARKRAIDQQRIDIKRHRRERRLIHTREDQLIQTLTENQGAMVARFLQAPDGIIKIRNDAALDVATLLVSKQILRRIRPWYDDHGHTIGEVFVIEEWVRQQALRNRKAVDRAEATAPNRMTAK